MLIAISQTDFDGTKEILDIESVLLNEITLFPNPANNEINIYGVDNLNAEIQIFDVLGKKQTEKASMTETTDGGIKIQLSQLASGTYYLKINDKIYRFIKI